MQYSGTQAVKREIESAINRINEISPNIFSKAGLKSSGFALNCQSLSR